MRGPDSDVLCVWTDEEVLADWCRANLHTYWRRWHAGAARLATGPGLASVTPFPPAWAVLGVSRAAYTATTGRLVSKTGAGLHARQVLDRRWQPIIDESLRIRTSTSTSTSTHPLYANPLARRRDTLAFVETALSSPESFQ